MQFFICSYIRKCAAQINFFTLKDKFFIWCTKEFKNKKKTKQKQKRNNANIELKITGVKTTPLVLNF